MGLEEPRLQGQTRFRVLAYLARFVFQLRQWLPLLAITIHARRLATSPSPSSY
jgi:hypothetical protein